MVEMRQPRGGLVVMVQDVASVEHLKDLLPNPGPLVIRAINSTSEWMRVEAIKRMRAAVKFPPGYLNRKESLELRKASQTSLRRQATITARFRPTSLARFSTDAGRRNGIHVEVTPGKRIHMPSAFLIKLNNGNMGVAIRGETWDRIYGDGSKFRSIYTQTGGFGDLDILYGPSVDQVFQTFARQMHGEVEEKLEDDFLALFAKAQTRKKRTV